jgi:transposase
MRKHPGNKGYSLDLREAARTALQKGLKPREVASYFNISISTVYNWKKLLAQHQSLESCPVTRSGPKPKVSPERVAQAFIKNPSLTQKELAHQLGISSSVMSKMVNRLKFLRKKNNISIPKEIKL